MSGNDLLFSGANVEFDDYIAFPTGAESVLIGDSTGIAFFSPLSLKNILIGDKAGKSLFVGSQNVAIGYNLCLWPQIRVI